MAKKKVVSKKNGGFLATLVALVLAIVSVVCMTAPFYVEKVGNDDAFLRFSIPGFTLTWGGDYSYDYKYSLLGTHEGTDTATLENTNGGMIAIFCLLAIGAVLLLAYLILSLTSLKNNKALLILPLLAFLVLVAGGVMAFFTLKLVEGQVTSAQMNSIITSIGGNANETLGAGAWLTGIIGILAGLGAGCVVVKAVK